MNKKVYAALFLVSIALLFTILASLAFAEDPIPSQQCGNSPECLSCKKACNQVFADSTHNCNQAFRTSIHSCNEARKTSVEACQILKGKVKRDCIKLALATSKLCKANANLNKKQCKLDARIARKACVDSCQLLIQPPQ